MVLDDARTLGAALRSARRAAGLSQQDLADRAGVARRTVVAVEQGHPRGEIGIVFQLLSALGLRVTLTPRPAGTRLDDLDAETVPL